MKTKHGLLLLAAALALPLIGQAQKAPTDDPDIMAFDQAVAGKPSIAKDIDLTLDVIGFDIQKGSSEEKQLADTAAAGVGKYYPVSRPEDLASIFTQVTTGFAAGGGGGMVMPKRGGLSPLMIGLITLGLGILALAIGIVALQRRRAPPAAASAAVPRVRTPRLRGGTKISARLDIFYSDGGTKSLRIVGARTTIGRREDNDVQINDSIVSGLHAEITASSAGFVIKDMGSTNGTFVNGQPVIESPIYIGDEIEIGTTKIVLGE